jgi:hypothetical protein
MVSFIVFSTQVLILERKGEKRVVEHTSYGNATKIARS